MALLNTSDELNNYWERETAQTVTHFYSNLIFLYNYTEEVMDVFS